ncbi:MAG: hypothetical protein ACTHU0_39515 [Kofleriaceae bacterium]
MLAILLAIVAVINARIAPVREFAPSAWVVDAWVEGARCADRPARGIGGISWVIRPDLVKKGARASWDEAVREMQFASRDQVTWVNVVHEAAHAHRRDVIKVHPRAVRDRCPFLDTWADY